MSKKEELIDKLVKIIMDGDKIGIRVYEARIQAQKLYDEIRASILTPRVVALLKAIGSEPLRCDDCKCSENYGEHEGYCNLMGKDIVLGQVKQGCPLLSSEELAEITGGDQ